MVNWQEGSDSFIDALSSAVSVPGGGSAAAVCGAMGTALLMMAGGVTIKKISTPEEDKKILSQFMDSLLENREILKNLAKEDSASFLRVLQARKMPHGKEREQAIADAMILAAEVPLKTAERIKDVLEISKQIGNKIAKIIASDLYCANDILLSGLRCCKYNIETNIPYLPEGEFKDILEKELEDISNLLNKLCQKNK